MSTQASITLVGSDGGHTIVHTSSHHDPISVLIYYDDNRSWSRLGLMATTLPGEVTDTPGLPPARLVDALTGAIQEHTDSEGKLLRVWEAPSARDLSLCEWTGPVLGQEELLEVATYPRCWMLERPIK